MSVDTKRWRELAKTSAFYPGDSGIPELCDEIDRLREQLNEQEFAAKKLEVENALLKERQRPRSIKDEPVTKLEPILCGPSKQGWDVVTFSTEYKPGVHPPYTYWLPMPPAPPEPDAFEVWWEHVFLPNDYQLDSKARIRMAWDAAIKSTKAKP